MNRYLSAALPVVRVLIAAVFIFSGLQKLLSPYENLLAVIHTYQLLPNALAVPLARTLPWAEFVFGVFLALGLWTRLSLAVLWLSNCAFIFALGQALWRKLPLGECGCFGDALTLPPAQMLLVDLAFFVVFLLLWVMGDKTRKWSADKFFHPPDIK